MSSTGEVTDVGVDLDGVVYPFVVAFRNYCAERLGTPDLPAATDWNFYRQWGIPDDRFSSYIDEAAESANVFSVLPPEPGSVRGWRELRSLGMRIHVVTHRPSSAWSQTAVWLHRWGLVPDTLTFSGDKTVVSHLAGGRRVVMVEDHADTYDRLVAAGIEAVLVDRPWNTGHPALRVEGFPGFVQHIKHLVGAE